MEKKVLFLAYYFPPLGGAGSQRSLKFVKYLPNHGFRPVVLGGAKGDNDRWAPVDEELAREIGPETTVRRVNLYARPFGGRLQRAAREALGLRGQFGARWLHGVKTAGRELCREHRPDLIFATMSPFDTAAGAAKLAAEFGIPWVADLRDPWALDEWQVDPTRWHRMLKRREMVRSLRSASLIIMNTPEAAERCRREFPALGHIPVIHLTNGFDAEDFAGDPQPSNPDVFTIVHAGAMHTAAGLKQLRQADIYRWLGKIADGVRLLPRSHYYLLQAVEKWLRDQPAIADRIALEFIGVPTAQDRAVVDASPAAPFTTFTGYLQHSESLRRVRTADLLFLPMHSVAPGQRATIVPGKTYEYLASGRHVLAAIPDGDAKDFLIRGGNATICAPEDVDAILSGLKARFELWQRGGGTGFSDQDHCRQFERSELTSRLAASLDKLLDQKKSAVPHVVPSSLPTRQET